jgi:predicted  nucleic acid-binding Zn-ribbon protein
MTVDEVRQDLEAKRVQLREFRRSLEGMDNEVSRYASTIASGRLKQIEMDINLLNKIV